MNPYRSLVAACASAVQAGESYPLGGFATPEHPPLVDDAPRALIFSPHPDDECIIGALPLRLRREAGWRITNVAVTQGSAKARQAERLAELKGACAYLGFELLQTAPNGLERVNEKSRAEAPAHWQGMVQQMAQLLEATQPQAIFFPHAQDWSPAHEGVHWLVMDALAALGPRLATLLVETEYWSAMRQPNLMVEVSEATLADQMAALSFHVGEVRRNPYHLRLPAWMQDNVRRGSELVAGPGQAAPDFNFATLYRLRAWRGGAVVDAEGGPRFLDEAADPAALFA